MSTVVKKRTVKKTLKRDRTQTARGYQERCILGLRHYRYEPEVCVIFPTGSGKTTILLAYIALGLKRAGYEGHFTHALIAAPQIQIHTPFWEPNYEEIRIGNVVLSLRDNGLGQKLVRPAHDGDEMTKAKDIEAYLGMVDPGYALACTHAALARVFKRIVNGVKLDQGEVPEPAEDYWSPSEVALKNLASLMCIIDEAHRSEAKKLGSLLQWLRERGTKVRKATATPTRTDGKNIFHYYDKVTETWQKAKVLARSYAQHAKESMAPNIIESEVIPVYGNGGRATDDEFAEALTKQWVEDARPKLFVHVPALAGKEGVELSPAYKMIGIIAEKFRALGARVFDASNREDASSVASRFTAVLKEERQVECYDDSQWDVIIGIKRIEEGTDWPLCAAVYFVGMPGALWLTQQISGRATRCKLWIVGYPEAWKDRAKSVFFVECVQENNVTMVLEQHENHALITTCFLADSEVARTLVAYRVVRDCILRSFGSKKKLGKAPNSRKALGAENAAEAPDMDPETRVSIGLALVAIEKDNGGCLPSNETLVDKVQYYIENMLPRDLVPNKEVSVEDIQTVCAQKVIEQNPKAEERFQRLLDERFQRNSSEGEDLGVREEVQSALVEVLNEFRKDHIILSEDPSTMLLKKHLASITSGRMGYFLDRVLGPKKKPLDRPWVIKAIQAHFALTGKQPSITSGTLQTDPEETWEEVARAVSGGLRSLDPEGFTELVLEALSVHCWFDDFEEFVVAGFDLVDVRDLRPDLADFYMPVYRATILFGKAFVSSLTRDQAVALGTLSLFKQAQKCPRGVSRFREVYQARRDNGDNFSKKDVVKLFKDHIHA